MRKGSPGQFDVVADGEIVARRKTGLLQSLFGSGWPDPADVITALHRRLGDGRQPQPRQP